MRMTQLRARSAGLLPAATSHCQKSSQHRRQQQCPCAQNHLGAVGSP